MSLIDDVVAANQQQAAGGRPNWRAPRLAIVTCMDERIETGKAFGLQEGGAHVIRNGGGRIADAIRSLVISQELLGTQELAIIHHTRCGMLTFTDDQLRERLRKKGIEADCVAFGPFSDLEDSVRIDLQLYRDNPLVRHDIPVRGFIFDVDTGLLREIS